MSDETNDPKKNMDDWEIKAAREEGKERADDGKEKAEPSLEELNPFAPGDDYKQVREDAFEERQANNELGEAIANKQKEANEEEDDD